MACSVYNQSLLSHLLLGYYARLRPCISFGRKPLPAPHDGKGRDKVQTRRQLLHKIEQPAKRTFPAAKEAVKDEARDRRPYNIGQFAEPRNGIARIADEVHHDTCCQRNGFPLPLHTAVTNMTGKCCGPGPGCWGNPEGLC